MKRFYLFMFALVCTMVAWADGVATVDGIRNGYIYTIQSVNGAITNMSKKTWNGTPNNTYSNYCVGATLNAYNEDQQFVAIKADDSEDCFYFYNVGAGKFLGKEGSQAFLTEFRDVCWKLKASGDETWPFMIGIKDGDSYAPINIIGVGRMAVIGYDGGDPDRNYSMQIAEVGVADDALLADIAGKPCGIQSGHIYTISSANNAVTWDGSSDRLVGGTLDASSPNHQFLAIRVAGSDDHFYFYNVGAGKFMNGTNTGISLSESCPSDACWELTASGDDTWPLMIGSFSSSIYIDTGGSIFMQTEDPNMGNSLQIEEVGVAEKALSDAVTLKTRIRDGYVYTLNVFSIDGLNKAITFDDTNSRCVADIADEYDPKYLFVATKVAGSEDCFYFYNHAVDKFLGTSGTDVSLTELREVYWKVHVMDDAYLMLQSQEGNFLYALPEGGETRIGYLASMMPITELFAESERLLADIAAKAQGIRNGYIYTIQSARNAITWDASSSNCIGATLDSSDPNHQFVAVKVAGSDDRFYFYNVGSGKFLGKSGAEASLTENSEVYWKLKGSGDATWPFMLDAQDGNHFNFNGSGQISIDSWNTVDEGNSLQITEVGTADEALFTAITMKVAGIKDGYIYTINGPRNAITWDGVSTDCVTAPLDASNPNHQFVAVKVAGTDNRFCFYNVGAGKFMSTTRNGKDFFYIKASLAESCEAYWNLTASGNETRPFKIYGGQLSYGYNCPFELKGADFCVYNTMLYTGTSLHITEVGAANEELLAAIASKPRGVWNGHIYTIRSTRSAVTWDGTSDKCVGAALDAENPNHQFVAIRIPGSDDLIYFYNVGSGKFMSKSSRDASLTDNCEVYWKLKTSGNETWPLMLDAQDGNHFNFGGIGQITIDGWSTVDAGNSLQIEEVGVADGTLIRDLEKKVIACIQQEYTTWKSTVSVGSGLGQYTLDREALAEAESALSAATYVESAWTAKQRCMAAYRLNDLIVGHYYRIKNTAQGIYLGIDGYTMNANHMSVTDDATGDNNPTILWQYEQDGDKYYMKNVYSGLYPQNIPNGAENTAAIGMGKDKPFTYAKYANPNETEVAKWNIFFGGRQVNCEGNANYYGNMNCWFGDNAHYYIYEVEAPEDAFASMCADWYKANPYTAPAKIELAEDAYKVISPSEFGNPVDINSAIDKLSLSADDATQEKVHQLFQNIISEASAVNAYVNAVNSYGALLSVVYETKAAEWATIILPVNWSKPEGWTRYSCAATEGNILTLAEVGDGVNKNTPFIIKVGEAQQGKKYQFIGYSTGAATTNQTAGLLTGVLEDNATVPVGSYILSKYNDKMGFYRVAEGTSYDAAKNKCYLTLPDAAVRYAALFFEGDTETGIDGISDTEAKQGNGVIYNMSGQRMNKMQKGLNIVNGKIILK